MGAIPDKLPTASASSALPIRWIVACLLLDLTAACLAPRVGAPTVILGATIGFFFAQTIFIAVCTVWLPAGSSTRVFFCVIATVIVAISVGLHTRSARIEIVFILAATVVCQWLVYLIPLLGMRLRGWQLQRIGGASVDVNYSSNAWEAQFGIQHILVWTSVVAILIGIGKIIARSTGIGNFSQTDLFVFAILVLGNSVLALPMIYGMFVRYRVLSWLVGSILWVVLWTPFHLFMIVLSIPGLPYEEIWMFGILDMLQVVLGAIFLNSLRRKGFRLVRTASKLDSEHASRKAE